MLHLHVHILNAFMLLVDIVVVIILALSFFTVFMNVHKSCAADNSGLLAIGVCNDQKVNYCCHLYI